MQGAKEEAADATETVDGDTSAHFYLPSGFDVCKRALYMT
jgi:hypothetical protein